MGLLAAVKEHTSCQLVACCEEDVENSLVNDSIEITHTDCDKMLAEVDCDVIAVGDYYEKRGSIIISALKAGKHVIADKPICTTLDELATIDNLSKAKQLSVGCQLDLRSEGWCRTMRTMVNDGKLGEVHTITFSGQHPLAVGVRPDWYFQDNCHGGTINDIAIHGIDLIPWMTGRKIAEVVAARGWNARCEANKSFQDGAQMMLRLDNDGGVLADVSYLKPEKCTAPLKQYWRFTVHGSGGMMEACYGCESIEYISMEDEGIQAIPCEPNAPHAYLDEFLREIAGETIDAIGLTTEQVIESARVTLLAQKAADKGCCNLSCK